MPSVVHAPLINTTGFMFREKTTESVSAFTAVNGRTSPPTPRNLNGMNGMSADSIHVRTLSRPTPEQTQDQKVPLPGRDHWNSTPRVSENGYPNGQHSVSPSLSDQDRSPRSPGKRKRSSSVEDDRSYPSPDDSSVSRQRLDSYASVGRDDSPNTAVQAQQLAMDHSQPRARPVMDRPESERPWDPSQATSHHGYQETQRREPRLTEHPQEGMHPNSTSQSQASAVDASNGLERSNTTEITRAGVQVDPKKRKRQFANRTKTGCGTCRRRKKKCDEAKPECNNCQRGGFICEGYANKVPWPKNGAQKPHPPLQAKDRFSVDPAQLYHSHGTNRESYHDTNTANGADGGRGRPIVVEEHDRQPARNGWGTSWSEARASYPPEQHQPPEYTQPPPTSSHGRPPSNDHHVPHPTQAPPPPRQHNPRIYHHTPQTMREVVNTSPIATAEAALHHQPQQHQQLMAPPTAGPPALPPAHYAPPPPRPPRSEKEKMLNSEPFMPFSQQLVEEREKCKGALYRYNCTSNERVEIARDEVDRHFRSILAAKWVLPPRGSEPSVSAHLGREVCVDPPFMCDYGYNLSIADRVDIGTGCTFLDSARITIGRDTTIGANVTIETQKTPTDSKIPKGSRRTAIAHSVHIGEEVFIGANCTILAGVKIGRGAIIHPGSVVVRDIPPHCVARGNPAEVRSVNWDD